ncbi:hypothetical protein J5TS2_15360 [Brevibacillus halotolerans]|nr:hypothetical protein J5TS2_15360 [Brevibacillus halotolerans]
MKITLTYTKKPEAIASGFLFLMYNAPLCRLAIHVSFNLKDQVGDSAALLPSHRPIEEVGLTLGNSVLSP